MMKTFRPLELPRGQVRWGERLLPDGYAGFLRATNGGIAHDVVRFFGYRSTDWIDGLAWNEEEWRGTYGLPAEQFYFFAEDLLGNQYAFDLHDGGSVHKLWCEGGEWERLDVSFLAFEQRCEREVASVVEAGFLAGCREASLWPSAAEHLGFVLPLVCGGEYRVDNVEVSPRNFHLSLLGQLAALGVRSAPRRL
jgi:hypothetical protein